MQYRELISKLRLELSRKNAPGPILDEIMFRRLNCFASQVEHNHDLLYLGATLGDIRIDEAMADGNKELHVKYALDYARQIYSEYEVPESDQEVIDEIISTHHGGDQKFIESKIYKNADNFKFLETRGAFHLFGALYNGGDEKNLLEVVSRVKKKLESKLLLTDWDDETISEAIRLKNYAFEVLDRIISPRDTK